MSKCDLDCAVVEQFGGAVAASLVHLVKASPCEEHHGLAVAEVEAGLNGAEGDCAAIVSADCKRGGAAQVELGAIPDIGFDNTPWANQGAVGERAHAGAARSLGSRTRL